MDIDSLLNNLRKMTKKKQHIINKNHFCAAERQILQSCMYGEDEAEQQQRAIKAR
jgi:hypothetical protein